MGLSVELTICQSVLRTLMNHRLAEPFLEPVDYIGLGLSDYPKIIKNPMDLSTVKEKLTMNVYNGPQDFIEDIDLIFKNAITYNPPDTDVFVQANMMKNLFHEKIQILNKPVAPVDTMIYDDLVDKVMNLQDELRGLRRLKRNPGEEDEIPELPLTIKKKQKLSRNISLLPAEQLSMVIKI